MIALRAVLLCESVRVDVDGKLTLFGVFSEMLVAHAGEGPIKPPSFAVLAVVKGLRGMGRVGIAHQIRLAHLGAWQLPLAHHDHDPEHDEHNFIFSRTDLVLPETGRYAIDIDVAAGAETLRASHDFHVLRVSG